MGKIGQFMALKLKKRSQNLQAKHRAGFHFPHSEGNAEIESLEKLPPINELKMGVYYIHLHFFKHPFDFAPSLIGQVNQTHFAWVLQECNANLI